MSTITTKWTIRTYDVLGNAKDGFEVNDVYSHGSTEMELEVKTANAGTDREFQHAELTDAQIIEALGLTHGLSIDVDGDDTAYYVNRSRDGYPIGELICESHDSLSPIREKTTV